MQLQSPHPAPPELLATKMPSETPDSILRPLEQWPSVLREWTNRLTIISIHPCALTKLV
jgi:hypothetical protein